MVVSMEIAASGSGGAASCKQDPGYFFFYYEKQALGWSAVLVGIPHTWLLTWWEWK
jgi:hypothetical protein